MCRTVIHGAIWALFALIAVARADTSVAPAGAAAAPRTLGFEGATNFRDIGGYATADGSHVRWQRVYRSNQLSRLTPADAGKVEALHIESVVDLRTEEERQSAPSLWLHGPPPEIYQSPQLTLAPLVHNLMRAAATPEGAHAAMIQFYAGVPDQYRVEYAALFHRLAAGHLPMLVHCTAGKDRTGVAVALLLSALGVERKEVVEDYTLTNQLLVTERAAAPRRAPLGGNAGAAISQLPEGSRQVLWRADPDYIQAALEAVEREYGSIDQYFIDGLGLSKAEIRSIRIALLQ